MKADSIVIADNGCIYGVKAGAPFMEAGKCFAPLTIRHLRYLRLFGPHMSRTSLILGALIALVILALLAFFGYFIWDYWTSTGDESGVIGL